MSSATLNIEQAADFWRVARRLHSVYAELDSTYELGMPPCSELEDSADRPEPEVILSAGGMTRQCAARLRWTKRPMRSSASPIFSSEVA